MDLPEQTLNTAINKALALDPELLEKLAAFTGKVISIHFTGVDKTLYLLPENHHMQVLTHYDGDVDTCISGTPISIIKMLMKPDVATMLLKGEIEISGDVRLGNAFKKLFREMEINWQQPLSKIIGDGATQSIESGVKRFNQWSNKSFNSFWQTASEYLQEESRDVVTETEQEIFNQQVDILRDDIDRLEIKLKNYIQEIN